MGLVSSIVNGIYSSTHVDDFLSGEDLNHVFDTTSGLTINEIQSMQVSTVFSCVDLISKTVAMLPLITYKRIDEGKKRATEHHLYKILHNKPNELMSSYQFRYIMQCYLLLYSVAYAIIDYDYRGQVSELTPVFPERVTKRKDEEGKYLYELRIDNEIITLPAYRILEINWTKSALSCSAIEFARNEIGLALATSQYGSNYFKNGTNVGSILSTDKVLGKEARENLKNTVRTFQSGISKSHKNMLLEEGVKFQKIASTQEESQYIETRKFQAIEITRFFGVPPHMVNILDNATFSNIEQQYIGYVRYCILPILVNWEQEINNRLIFDDYINKGIFVEFLFEGLLRGDIKTRTESYRTMFSLGALSPNEIRAYENLNSYKGGDKHYVMLNMTTVEGLNTNKEAFAMVLDDVFARINRIEQADLKKIKDDAGFASFIEKHEAYMIKNLEKTCTAYAIATDKDIIKSLTALKEFVGDYVINLKELFVYNKGFNYNVENSYNLLRLIDKGDKND